MTTHNTQKEVESIAAIQELQKTGKRIVALSGAFDLLHHGHLYFLQEAKKQGDILVVFLNSDASVKRHKGEMRPIISEDERTEMLLALLCVDYVIVFDDDTPVQLLDELKPDVYCNGSDWGRNCIERKTIENHGGHIHVIPRRGQSTTAIIEKIQNIHV